MRAKFSTYDSKGVCIKEDCSKEQILHIFRCTFKFLEVVENNNTEIYRIEYPRQAIIGYVKVQY